MKKTRIFTGMIRTYVVYRVTEDLTRAEDESLKKPPDLARVPVHVGRQVAVLLHQASQHHLRFHLTRQFFWGFFDYLSTS